MTLLDNDLERLESRVSHQYSVLVNLFITECTIKYTVICSVIRRHALYSILTNQFIRQIVNRDSSGLGKHFHTYRKIKYCLDFHKQAAELLSWYGGRSTLCSSNGAGMVQSV
jgi:hypothetical protein